MPRRRIVIKVIALLLAGAAINVAVAWGCVWLNRPSKCGEWIWFRTVVPPERDDLNLEAFVPEYMRTRWNGEVVKDGHCFVGMRRSWYCRGGSLNGMPVFFAVRIEAGWPAFALKGLSGHDPDQPRAFP